MSPTTPWSSWTRAGAQGTRADRLVDRGGVRGGGGAGRAPADYGPRPRLGGLRVPVHFLHGELDTEVPLKVPRECAALIPGAGLTVIEGAGHMSQQDQPERFNTALRAALASMPERAA
ncbi:alpha/beta fold hydrolase [Streptomyces goshikiensis]|uniref:alpha/beta fold hydrolase n=1 Tax=Streptomyces goshikiensis TaxID=1942 RepID=UPI003646211D